MISVIIPWRRESQRRERLYEVVKSRWKCQDLGHEVELVVGENDEQPFNRGRARNNAVAQSTGDILAIADADTVCNSEFLREAIKRVFEEPWVFPYRVYYNMSEQGTDRMLNTLKGGPGRELERPERDAYDYALPSCGGIFLMTRENFDKVGGYDESFVGWGYEDNAFALAADTVLGRHDSVGGGWVCHLWHEAPEEARFNQPSIGANRKRFVRYQEAAGDPVAMMELKHG